MLPRHDGDEPPRRSRSRSPAQLYDCDPREVTASNLLARAVSLIRVPDAAYQRLWVDMSYQIIAWLRAPGEGPARNFVCQCPHCGMDVTQRPWQPPIPSEGPAAEPIPHTPATEPIPHTPAMEPDGEWID